MSLCSLVYDFTLPWLLSIHIYYKYTKLYVIIVGWLCIGKGLASLSHMIAPSVAVQFDAGNKRL